MQWQDEGVVLAARRHGETGLLLSAFTKAHGRHAGLVPGGASRKARPLYQIGNRVQLAWRARLADQLGSLTGELITPYAALIMPDPARLAGLAAACALLDTSLAERDPHPELYNLLWLTIDSLATSGRWQEDYVRFELALLAELGFGLDLASCAVTGVSTDLAFVSPRSGRAVSRSAAGAYADRLLPLPAFLVREQPADPAGIAAGLRLTGAFLERHVYAPHNALPPPARQALQDRIERRAAASISKG